VECFFYLVQRFLLLYELNGVFEWRANLSAVQCSVALAKAIILRRFLGNPDDLL
jgi:hypothetical protein